MVDFEFGFECENTKVVSIGEVVAVAESGENFIFSPFLLDFFFAPRFRVGR